MEQDNMIEDPSQKQRPSVFRFDGYPGGPLFPWNANQQPKFGSPTSPYTSNSSIFPNFPPSSHMNMPPVAPQVPTSFSFGSPPSTSTMGGQFPFQITTHELGDKSFKLVLGKRKTDSPPLQLSKQLITEEKMAEHMSNLHINSETAISPLEPESVKNKRLYMCEEMRKLQAEPLIPPCLVSQIQRPCTALVLWQPPSKLLPLSDDETTENHRNNEDPNQNTRYEYSTFRNIESLETDGDLGVGNMEMDS